MPTFQQYIYILHLNVILGSSLVTKSQSNYLHFVASFHLEVLPLQNVVISLPALSFSFLHLAMSR